ncbi:MAG: hypothetical protein AAFO69_03230 [Bacteroidota bacterium]
MIYSILSLLVNLLSSGALHTEVKLIGDKTICDVSYSFPDQSTSKMLEYKPIDAESWNSVSLRDEAGVKTLTSLVPDRLYVCRLTWREDGVQSNSRRDYFRTYKSLASTAPDYENYKIIVPRQHPGSETHRLFQGKLSFVYKDQYRQQGYLTGKILNEDAFVAGRFYLPKNTAGVYHVDLSEIRYNWENDKVYTIELTDDHNASSWMLVSFEEADGSLDLNINASAVHVDCTEGFNSVIQYSGRIAGGSLPYSATWTVTDVAGGNVLYGPATTEAIRGNELPAALLEVPIPYLLTLSVFDGCGLFEETSLLVSCRNEEDSDDVLLFERYNPTYTGEN